jgi:hypothetical protein
MAKNCTNYDSDSCPKGMTIIKKLNEPMISTIMVGCWGVYCWDGEVDIKEWKGLKDGEEIPEDVEKLFDKGTEIYGQKSVVEGMKQYAEKKRTSALFLAGDNVYNFMVPKTALEQIAIKAVQTKNKDIIPTKAQYKANPVFSGQEIERQLSQGFSECLRILPREMSIFLTIGNHDVQNCHDLNTQLNYYKTDPKYQLPGMYYNVIYNMQGFSVNFILIDTNMFTEDFTCDGKTEYTKEQKKEQAKWVRKALKKGGCEFNIMIGHVPYKANGHKEKKEKDKTIYTKGIEKIFEKIAEKGDKIPKIQVYMCADEHNQQFLYDPEKKLSLVVSGSGGTALDTFIAKGLYDDITKHRDATFGFVGFEITRDFIDIQYIKTEVRGQKMIPTFRTRVDINGNLIG